jgi:hypothetical protein
MKFNLGVYHKLSKDDKTEYASSFETTQKKSPFTPMAIIKTWQDRNVKNRGTKLNPINEQIKFAQSYTKKLNAYNKALQSQSNKSKDRGGKGTLEPSADFAGTREFPGELIQRKAKANKKKYIS